MILGLGVILFEMVCLQPKGVPMTNTHATNRQPTNRHSANRHSARWHSANWGCRIGGLIFCFFWGVAQGEEPPLWVASPLTMVGEFTKGIEGPATDNRGTSSP